MVNCWLSTRPTHLLRRPRKSMGIATDNCLSRQQAVSMWRWRLTVRSPQLRAHTRVVVSPRGEPLMATTVVHGALGEGWNDATENQVPDWIQVDFAGSKTIDEISVFSLHDNYTQENTPTETQTFTLYGLLAFDVQYWNGSTWVTIPGGSVTGNNKVWRKFTFSPITTNRIRVFINTVPDAWSRVVEIQAFGTSASGEKVRWLVPDHLGTPRIIVDQTGSLAGIKRHDYLPFGEELFAGAGGRTAAMGYAADGVRQQFTSKERDIETGLDYFGARYYSSTQGRFSGVDPGNYQARLDLSAPQSWNAYSYVDNNPLVRVDPDGKGFFDKLKNWLLWDVWGEEEDVKREEEKRRSDLLRNADQNGGIIIMSPVTGQYVRVYPSEMNRANVWLWSNAVYYWQEQGGGYHQLTPDQLASVIDIKNYAKQIADGHSWSKHQKEFPGWDKQKCTDKIDETVREAKGSNVRNLSAGARHTGTIKRKWLLFVIQRTLTAARPSDQRMAKLILIT